MKNYHIVSRIAIYLLAVVMISFGIYHFQHARELVVYIPSFLPGGLLWVYLVGAAFILVAISFVTVQHSCFSLIKAFKYLNR